MSPPFQRAADLDRQAEIARALETRWRCELHGFDRLCPLDWYATRGGEMVGVVELKTHPREIERYPVVWLSFRKWLALELASFGLGVPGVFVVQFGSRIFWTRVSFGMGEVGIDGRHDRGAAMDVEPIIYVPKDAMREVRL